MTEAETRQRLTTILDYMVGCAADGGQSSEDGARAHAGQVLELWDAQAAQIQQKDDTLNDPQKWMRWCDHKMLERCEAAEAQIQQLQEGMIAANELTASIRYLCWQVIDRRGADENDHSLVGLVRIVVNKLEEARDNRRGEYELRTNAERENARLTARLRDLIKEWRDEAEFGRKHRQGETVEDPGDGYYKQSEVFDMHADALAALLTPPPTEPTPTR